MTLQDALTRILLLLGIGFLVANVLKGLEIVRWLRRRRTALLVWPGPKPPYYGLMLGIGVMLGLLVLFKAFVQLRPLSQLFGELMMFVYYGYMLPISTRIARGLYADGVWTDTGFISYRHIGGISWREEGETTVLVVISRLKMLARRLAVPGRALGEVRRVLRDKIASHAIEIDAGVSILPEPSVRREIALGSLAKVAIAGDALARPLGIVRRRDRTLSELARQFIGLLKADAEFREDSAPAANGARKSGSPAALT